MIVKANVYSAMNTSTMTVRVTRTGVWILRMRVAIGVLLIRLAGKVIGSRVVLEYSEAKELPVPSSE